MSEEKKKDQNFIVSITLVLFAKVNGIDEESEEVEEEIFCDFLTEENYQSWFDESRDTCLADYLEKNTDAIPQGFDLECVSILSPTKIRKKEEISSKIYIVPTV